MLRLSPAKAQHPPFRSERPLQMAWPLPEAARILFAVIYFLTANTQTTPP
jgi:hypothetical protein